MHKNSYDEMRRLVKKYLDPEKELSILDIGSKDVSGTYKHIFGYTNWKYVGLDIRPGPNVDILAESEYSYPVEDHMFDIVISGQTLEHVRDTSRFIKEAARVLKKDGIMIMIAPWSFKEHRHPIDCWRIMPDGMRYLFEEVAGLNVTEIYLLEDDCIGVGVGQDVDTETMFLDKEAFGPDIRLNLGCGFNHMEGFINIDNRDECHPDLLCDVIDGLPFDDSSIDYVLAQDFLEHIPTEENVNVIEEIYRVLKPGCVLEVIVPSTDGRGAFQDPFHVSFWNKNKFIYFTNDHYRNLYGIKAKFDGQVTDHVTNEEMKIIHTHAVLRAVKEVQQ